MTEPEKPAEQHAGLAKTQFPADAFEPDPQDSATPGPEPEIEDSHGDS